MRLKAHTESGKMISKLLSCGLLTMPRKKMESNMVAPLSSKVDGGTQLRAIELPQPDNMFSFRAEVPPWAESYEISSTDVDGNADVLVSSTSS
jgi:hypothetical protein